MIRPRVGFSDRNSRRSSVVLPAPDGPLRNWNERSRDVERDVAEDLRSHSVAQADILEADQLAGNLDAARREPTVCMRRPSAGMVNRRLMLRPLRLTKSRSVNHFRLPRNDKEFERVIGCIMADERNATPGFRRNHDRRPRRRHRRAAADRRGDDIVDAEYRDGRRHGASPRRRPGRFRVDRHANAAARRHGHAARLASGAAPAAPRRGGPLFWIFGVGLAVGRLLGFRRPRAGAQVRHSCRPQPAASALRISDVTSRVDVSGPRPVLFVDGEAANDGSAAETLPPLEIRVTGNDGRMTRYRLGTSGRSMAPARDSPFRAASTCLRTG